MLVLAALCMVALAGIVSLATDGGWQLYQLRMTQTAVDTASLGAARTLATSCGASSPTARNRDVWNVVDDVTRANEGSLSSWGGYYLNAQGGTLTGTPLLLHNDNAPVPVGACGVHLQAQSQWRSMLSQVLGFSTLSVAAHAGAIATTTSPSGGSGDGIMSLASDSIHGIYGGGSGAFRVNGDVFDNASGNPTWGDVCFKAGPDPDHNGDNDTASATDPDHNGLYDGYAVNWVCPAGDSQVEYTDAIDAKDNSSVAVTGTLTCVANNCLDRDTANPYPPPLSPNNVPGQPGPVPYDPTLPQYAERMSAGAVIAYNGLVMRSPMSTAGSAPTTGQLVADPLVAAYGAPPNSATPGCGGAPAQTFTSLAQTPGRGGPFAPGVYTFPLDVTGSPGAGPGSPTFAGCPGGVPGIYILEQGLNIHPTAPQAVYGANVLFITQSPVPNAVLPNNVGNGAPFGASNSVPVVFGTGLNLSTAMGGTGTVDLLAATSGRYAGLLLWQTQTTDAGAPARGNVGFNTSSGDRATIHLTGQVGTTTMNESSTRPGLTDYRRYWQPVGTQESVPYQFGGVLISGQPVLDTTPPVGSQGTTTITGSAVVDVFLTQGNAVTTITATSSQLTSQASSLAVRLVE